MGTIALGYGSHAEGNSTTSIGAHSHSEGSGTTAYGDYSHAGGRGSYSAGDSSFTHGKSVTTLSNYSAALGINSTASGVTSFVFGDTSLAANDGVIVLGNSITGNTSNYVYVNSLNVKTVGSSAFVNDIRIDSNGNLTTNTSDERLKENIQPINNTLETIKSIQGVTYQWKDRNAGGDDIKLGFIAQQLESVEPKLVFTNKVDGFKGIHIDGIVSLLVESVKEQQSIIEKLNEEINSLKGRLDNLGNL
jgi:hypothetical protein